MCQVMIENGAFDPELCPLLRNLSPDEIAMRMKQEPFVTCMAQFEAGKHNPPGECDHQCPAVAAEATA